jgi:hypothetical protein
VAGFLSALAPDGDQDRNRPDDFLGIVRPSSQAQGDLHRVEAGWVGIIVQQVDYQYGPKKTAHGTQLGDDLRLQLAPSEYFTRNLWFTFMDDRAAVLTTPIYGEDNFMWASDYPHAACTWPLLASDRREDLCRAPAIRSKRKLCRDNVNQVYNLGFISSTVTRKMRGKKWHE